MYKISTGNCRPVASIRQDTKGKRQQTSRDQEYNNTRRTRKEKRTITIQFQETKKREEETRTMSSQHDLSRERPQLCLCLKKTRQRQIEDKVNNEARQDNNKDKDNDKGHDKGNDEIRPYTTFKTRSIEFKEILKHFSV